MLWLCVCLSVCLSVCHKSVYSKGFITKLTDSWLYSQLHPAIEWDGWIELGFGMEASFDPIIHCI